MSLKSIYDKVSHILEKHTQWHKEAMASLQALGYNGYKRWHRLRAKELQCYQMKLANILFNIEREKLDMQCMSLNYSPMSLREHLKQWISEIEYTLKELGTLNKMHFEEVGMTSCIIEDIVKMLLDDIGNIQRNYYQFEACDWLEMFTFIEDRRLHEKFKKKEEDK